ncbi:MAG: tRNA lysidine(34) synthetase TilS [Povalibacter sp.]
MSFTPAALWNQLESHWPTPACSDVLIAFSGGLDSTALLAAIVEESRERGVRVRAIHIDHQLQAASGEWSRHCIDFARALNVECTAVQVAVDLNSEDGIESAARKARYDVLRKWLRAGEILLTAHHADDQLETIVLALTRGSGLAGLSGMPACRPFAEGWHVRPMLPFTRDEIESWARANSLTWISDPSNDKDEFSRNLLRNRVTPALRERWPSIAKTASRSARHVAEAASLLDEFASEDFLKAALGSCLRVNVLTHMSAPRRRNLLRYWLRHHGARLPSARKLVALEHDMLRAAEDRLPKVQWDGFEVRRHRGLLYGTWARANAAGPSSFEWHWREPLALGTQLGELRMQRASLKGLDELRLATTLRVEFRQGGERLKLIGRNHHHSLKKLLQEAGVLPWWRNRLPLIWNDDALVAVGDLWVADEFAASVPNTGLAITWERRPPILAVMDDEPT